MRLASNTIAISQMPDSLRLHSRYRGNRRKIQFILLKQWTLTAHSIHSCGNKFDFPLHRGTWEEETFIHSARHTSCVESTLWKWFYSSKCIWYIYTHIYYATNCFQINRWTHCTRIIMTCRWQMSEEQILTSFRIIPFRVWLWLCGIYEYIFSLKQYFPKKIRYIFRWAWSRW